MIDNQRATELQRFPSEMPGNHDPVVRSGQFVHKKVSKTNEMADKDHSLVTRSLQEKVSDAGCSTLWELLRFNISQLPIDGYNYLTLPRDPVKSACVQANNEHMQALFEGEYQKFTSFSSQVYLSKTNENIFSPDNQPLIKAEVQQCFTDIIKSITLGDHKKPEPEEPSQGSQQGEKTAFSEKLTNLFSLVKTPGNVHVYDDAASRLDKPHIPTPETIIAKLKQDIDSGNYNDEALLEKLQGDCEQLTALQLKTIGMAAYTNSLQIECPQNSDKTKVQVAAGYINKAAAFLSDKVPPYYLSILGVVLLERLAAGGLKADALNDMMSAPAMNISAPVREKVVAYARNLYRAEKVDDVSMKPGNVITTTMAFTLYVTGSLQLLISQADHSKNSELMDQCFDSFVEEYNSSQSGEAIQQPTEPGVCDRFSTFVSAVVRNIGIIAIGLRAIMNGAYEIKDATPDNALRDTIYNSVLGKSFVPLSLIENAGYKDDVIQKNKEVLLNRCLTKDVLGEQLTDEEKDFMKGIKGESGSGYSMKAGLTKAFTYGTTIMSSAVLATDIATSLSDPVASKNFWHSPVQADGAVTYSHVYKAAIRPISVVLNLLQVMCVSGSEYTKDDVEAFIHIGSRLLLATAPLIMWEKGLTLWDSIAAMIDTAITVGEDSAASRSLNKGQLAKQVEVAINNLRLEAFNQSTETTPTFTGEYMDQLHQNLMDRLLSADGVPEEFIFSGAKDEEAGLLKRHPSQTFV